MKYEIEKHAFFVQKLPYYKITIEKHLHSEKSLVFFAISATFSQFPPDLWAILLFNISKSAQLPGNAQSLVLA